MKRLKFKNPLKGLDNAKKLIPESYKTDGNEFEMTDGNETYRVKWESDLNEGSILNSSIKSQINEDMQKMKHLMGFKSEATLGAVKGAARLDENKKFNEILGKGKKLIKENSGIGFSPEPVAGNRENFDSTIDMLQQQKRKFKRGDVFGDEELTDDDIYNSMGPDGVASNDEDEREMRRGGPSPYDESPIDYGELPLDEEMDTKVEKLGIAVTDSPKVGAKMLPIRSMDAKRQSGTNMALLGNKGGDNKPNAIALKKSGYDLIDAAKNLGAGDEASGDDQTTDTSADTSITDSNGGKVDENEGSDSNLDMDGIEDYVIVNSRGEEVKRLGVMTRAEAELKTPEGFQSVPADITTDLYTDEVDLNYGVSEEDDRFSEVFDVTEEEGVDEANKIRPGTVRSGMGGETGLKSNHYDKSEVKGKPRNTASRRYGKNDIANQLANISPDEEALRDAAYEYEESEIAREMDRFEEVFEGMDESEELRNLSDYIGTHGVGSPTHNFFEEPHVDFSEQVEEFKREGLSLFYDAIDNKYIISKIDPNHGLGR